jgi:hypothetical protein
MILGFVVMVSRLVQGAGVKGICCGQDSDLTFQTTHKFLIYLRVVAHEFDLRSGEAQKRDEILLLCIIRDDQGNRLVAVDSINLEITING